ncbi:hypothetical protein HMI54_004378, partial [Coelomomyces lativittatus]
FLDVSTKDQFYPSTLIPLNCSVIFISCLNVTPSSTLNSSLKNFNIPSLSSFSR